MRKTNRKVVQENDNSPIYVDEMYFRHVDQAERWRHEYERWQAVETKLAAVSIVDYREIDYLPLLEKVPFMEGPMPDYSQLLVDARITAQGKYFMPIAAQSSIIFILAFIVLLSNNSIVLWLAGGGIIAVLGLLYATITARQRLIVKAVAEAQAEIQRRIDKLKQRMAEERKVHDSKEEARIKEIERLLTGEISAIFAKLESILPKMGLPFPINIDIEMYADIPLVQIWLPSKSIIPRQVCIMQQSGRITFTDKEVRTVNKQYVELCAAVIIKVVSFVFSYIPTVNMLYVQGLSKEKLNIECLLLLQAKRELMMQAASAINAVSAMQVMQGKYECDTALELLSLNYENPSEWGEVEQQLVRTLHLKLFR